jgi:hypothetical protein
LIWWSPPKLLESPHPPKKQPSIDELGQMGRRLEEESERQQISLKSALLGTTRV